MSEPRDVPPAPMTASRAIAWVAAAGLAVVEAFGTAYATALVYWGASSGCNRDPVAENRTDGLMGLLLLVAIAAGPWLVVAAIRRKWSVGLLGVLAASPALWGIVHGLSLESWRGDFCF